MVQEGRWGVATMFSDKKPSSVLLAEREEIALLQFRVTHAGGSSARGW